MARTVRNHRGCSFHLAMKGDFRQRIPLPLKFAWKFKKKLSGTARLKDPTGKEWCVGLNRIAGRIFLEDGWREFIEHNSICTGHLLVFKYSSKSMFDVLIFDKSSFAKKLEKSSSRKRWRDPHYESDTSLEILGECTPDKAHLNNGQGNNLQQTRRRLGRIPFLRSHGQCVTFSVMETESKCKKRKNGREELLVASNTLSSKRSVNTPEPRRSTRMKSAQSDRLYVPKIPEEVELSFLTQKDCNEDPSFQSMNLSTASKEYEFHNGILMDEIGNESQQPISRSSSLKTVKLDWVLEPRRSARLKSAQSDIPYVPKLSQEVESMHRKRKDGAEDLSLKPVNLTTASGGPFPCEVLDGIENENQQPTKKQDNFEVLQLSYQAGGTEVRGLGDVIESNNVEQFTAREEFLFCLEDPSHKVQNSIACNKVARDDEPHPSSERDSAPQCLEHNKMFQSNMKKHEESNSCQKSWDPDCKSESSVEILDVLSPHKAQHTEGGGVNLQPTKISGGHKPWLRSRGPPVMSNVMGTKSECTNLKHVSKKLLIRPEVQSSKRRGIVLEPSQSSHLGSSQFNKIHLLKLSQKVELAHHNRKDGDAHPSFQSANLGTGSKGSLSHEVHNIAVDEIENKNQQPIRKEDSFKVLRRSSRLHSIRSDGQEVRVLDDVNESNHVKKNTMKEKFSFDILHNDDAKDDLQPSDDMVMVPRRSERIKSFQSCGKCLDGLFHGCGSNCTKMNKGSEQAPVCSERESNEHISASFGEEFSTNSESQRTKFDHHVRSKNVEYSRDQGQRRDMPVNNLYCRFLSNRRPVTDEERERAKTEARKFNSDKPFFLVVMPFTYVYIRYFMHIPQEFVKDYIRRGLQYVTLVGLNGRRWPVRCLWRGHGAGLSKGWAAFVWENNLEEGDVCVFELADRENIEFRVTIFRVVEEVVPLVKAVESEKNKKATRN